MSSIDDENVIQAFFPSCADPAFGEGVGIGSSDWSVNDMQAFRLENSIKWLAETAVIFMDQEPQGLISVGKIPYQLPGLLRNPDLIRVGGDTSKMDTPRTQFNEVKYVDCLKPDGFHGEKVTRKNLFFEVSHQVTPANRTISSLRWLDDVTVEVFKGYGQTSTRWYPQKDSQGEPVVQIMFDAKTCLACPTRPQCTKAKDAGRTLVLRAEGRHQALQTARERQQTDDFKKLYRKRNGIEGTLSQGIRSCGLRRSRYVGQAKTHLQNMAIAVATNIMRLNDWLNEVPLALTRQSRFTLLLATA